MYVAAGTGHPYHQNRLFHGFVINDSSAHKYIHFSDGTVLDTPPNSFHYLPKGSTYYVETITSGGCWAINFELDKPIQLPPFAITPRDHTPVLRHFKESTETWLKKKPFFHADALKNLYSIISYIGNEHFHTYIPSSIRQKILPAENEIHERYTDPYLSVGELAEMCNVSTAYFRRIFNEIHAMSPKDYICSLRIDRAKALLANSTLSILEVALECGYSDPCYFSRDFHKRVGISPSVYRTS